MKHQAKILLGVSMVLLFGVGVYMTTSIFFGIKNKDPFPKSVTIDYDDCVRRGYEVTHEKPSSCKTPSGVQFLNLKEMLAVIEVTEPMRHKIITAQSVKDIHVSTSSKNKK